MKQGARPIGMHVRLYNGLLDIIPVVEQLQLDVAQSFLMTESNSYVALTNKVISNFVKSKEKLKFLYFVHAAYWSGLTDSSSKMFASLEREVEIAEALCSNGIVVHCGAIKTGSLSKQDQLKYVVESINRLNYAYPGVTILLENTPHAGRSFGGNLQDFAMIVEHVEKKDLVGFCVDTAHAFVYGYDLFHEKGRNDFLQLVQDCLGREHVKLLHLNDSQDRVGSHIDKHEVPGDGLIGTKALQKIMKAPLFCDVPLIMELPGNCVKNDADVINLVRSWQE